GIVMKALALDPKLRFRSAGEMSRELEAFAAKRGIQVGHAVVAEAMHRWFEPSGSRRRFPRASSEVETGKHEKQDPDDFDDTPIELIEPIELSTDRLAALDPPTERSAKPTVPIHEAPTTIAAIGDEAPTIPLEPLAI